MLSAAVEVRSWSIASASVGAATLDPVETDRVEIETPRGALPAFLVATEDWPRGPAVVVIQEWWGLNGQIRGVARRVAEGGFAALVPDLYRGKQADEPNEARKLAMELDRTQAEADASAAVGWLLERGATGVGVVGFCMGGGIVWELARSEERLGAAVPFYGGVDFREGGPAAVPFQAHYGAEDRFPQEMVEAIEAHRSDVPGSELHLYEGAGHAFMNEEDDGYRADAAALAWERMLSFFRERLG